MLCKCKRRRSKANSLDRDIQHYSSQSVTGAHSTGEKRGRGDRGVMFSDAAFIACVCVFWGAELLGSTQGRCVTVCLLSTDIYSLFFRNDYISERISYWLLINKIILYISRGSPGNGSAVSRACFRRFERRLVVSAWRTDAA